MPPDVGLAPSAAWRALPQPRAPPPPRQARPPLLEHSKTSQGVGGEEGGTVGSEELWLEGRVLQLPWGGPSKGQMGPDPHLGPLD